MAIWRKKNPSNTSEENEAKTGDPELPKEQERKRKAILDLNMPYNDTEENDEAETMLPTKRSGCMARSDNKTPSAIINVHKYATHIPPKLMIMGCTACYVFVMVQENYRICPRCGQGESLMDLAAHFNSNKDKGN